MKNNYIISLLSISIFLLFANCKKEKETDTNNATPTPIIKDKPTTLTNGLLFSYNFSNNFRDESSNNLHLDSNLSSAYNFTTDRKNRIDQAINFNGSGKVTLPNSQVFKVQFPFTISMWVNVIDSSDTDNRFIYSDGQTIYYGFWIQTTGTGGQLSINYGDGTGNGSSARNSAVTSLKIRSNKWQHIIAQINGYQDFNVYINGISDTNLTYSGTASSIAYSSTQGLIGQAPGYPYYLSGKMDKIRMWNRALTPSEISEEYSSTK